MMNKLQQQIEAKKEKMEKAEAKAKAAKAELRRVEARLNESKRKARTRLLIQFGAEVFAVAGDKELDFEKWKSYVHDYAGAIIRRCTKEETPDQDTMHPYQAPDEQQPEYQAQNDSGYSSSFFN